MSIPRTAGAGTSPLLQFWYRHMGSKGSPYGLYAYSNLGSLIALLTFPFLFERFYPLTWQTLFWRCSFILYALLCIRILLKVRSIPDTHGHAEKSSHQTRLAVKRPSMASFVWWVALSACGVSLLLSATNEMCRNIAPIALLWVVPLVIYLLTFIVTFKWERLYHRTGFGLALICVIFANVGLLVLPRHEYFLRAQVLSTCLALLVGCMICHGELVKAKPDSRHLASFYFALSLGGAIAGVLITLVAPLLFDQYVEWALSIFCCCLLIQIAFRLEVWRSLDNHSKRRDQNWTIVRLASLAGVFVAVWIVARFNDGEAISFRNFYGVLTVRTIREPVEIKQLIHAATVHGAQVTHGDQRRVPTCYYGPKTGVGLAIDYCTKAADGKGIYVGCVGMGVGTVASYLTRGDHVRFFEINPVVVDISETEFSFVKDAKDRGVDVVTLVGDGRLLLQRDLQNRPDQHFDLLIIDAFSGDSVPVHLLTRECFSTYWEHLAENGILAIHISNQILDFEPVIRGQQLADRVAAAVVRHEGANSWDFASLWVLLARDPAVFSRPEFAQYSEKWSDPNRFVFWTDDYSSITQILKW